MFAVHQSCQYALLPCGGVNPFLCKKFEKLYKISTYAPIFKINAIAKPFDTNFFQFLPYCGLSLFILHYVALHLLLTLAV